MLSDLRRYITTEREILPGSIAYYVKTLLEISGDEKLVKQVTRGLEKGRREIIDNEIYPFRYLINDTHLTDILNLEEDNIIIRLILTCFTDQFIIQDMGMNVFDLYLSLTKTGREISGRKDDEYLVDFIEREWPDLDNEIGGIKEELIKMYAEGDAYECYNEYESYAMVIIVDENQDCYSDLYIILRVLGFAEVVPGLFFYGAFGYDGYDGCDIELNKCDLEQIEEVLSTKQKIRNLNKYNEHFNVFNVSSFGPDEYLYNLFKVKSSEREVIF